MSFSIEQLARHPKFVASLRFLAEALRNRYDNGPRIARMLASHQRWLLTQTAYALHLEHDPAIPGSGLTVVALRDLITRYRVASRNTVLSFIEELQTYRFLELAPGPVRRPRRYVPTEMSFTAMFGWYLANLTALDLLDDGARAAALAASPALMDLAQPRMARNCLEMEIWREPPECIGLFLWTEAGGLVVDHIISKLDLTEEGDRIDIGRVDARALAAHFMISRTHLQRLLRKSAERGDIGWHDEVKTRMWVSRNFLDEYCGWQAVKLAAIDEAFAWARSAQGRSAVAIDE
ncbi:MULTISPECIES: hypothetical protein [Rhizobium]|uniref:Uncharacterized protein n=1 Tax=Rhizobium tropici TaxID=398 RepID=A0A329YC55_RHITR|nr:MULTISPECIES: hypothetical protein [Rhizobium]MBB3288093.1 hypothetical protein [Rhizobium sp. BK252]MBB3403044.1 hypothetical protein [Rhizobium sp. BK289]MBB3415621.1 hypothetical protein [Rhizobium sp. BK284]MBB3483299.1 hypothetical protein [Rhizobium sp. BK347]MDK4724124.1 hypothetical protein [Rhizobium sp. CNPSo 3968]